MKNRQYQSRLPARLKAGVAPAVLMALVAAICLPATHAHAQTLTDKFSEKAKTSGEKDKLLVDAKELVYDQNKNVVTAVGDVQLYYQGRILEADKVIYDRNTNRVYAEGNAKLTDENGGVTHAGRFELTDDFKSGFIDSLSTIASDKTRFTSPRAERTDGQTTVFDSGTYTACEPCKDNPQRAPLWQVRAKRIIHKNDEQMVYYEGARLEMLGVPIAYFPYLSAPDASVSRKSGLLTPTFIGGDKVGTGIAIPFFWNLAPNYDLTFTGVPLSRQGFMGRVEWRHRIDTPWITGAYNIRTAGIFQRDPEAFYSAPVGPGTRQWRGSIESTGKFFLSEKWKFGWDIAAMSDRWFFDDYKVPSESIGQTYFRESISTVYLTGQGDRGFFDLRGFYIRGLSTYDLQRQQPLVRPVWDYNKTIDLPEARTRIGGQLELDFNFTSLSRDIAAFQSTGVRRLDNPYGYYDVCEVGAKYYGTPNYNRNDCLLRGIGGDYTRLTAQATWKRQIVTGNGMSITPFAFLNAQGSWLNLDTTRSYLVNSGSLQSLISNASQTNFLTSSPDFLGSIMPGAGVEWRYPFFATSGSATHVIEPIVQVVARPNELNTYKRPNEDAQSLVFDDTNLFALNKFSGYDRTEGGTRVNYGAQYTATFKNGGWFNVLAGQSYQAFGSNSYALGDVVHTGVNSGLQTRLSDFISRVAFSPWSGISFSAKGRFDQENFGLKRFDASANISWGSKLSTQVLYARYAQQPEIGQPYRREGIYASAKYNLTPNYWITGTTILDLDRHLADKDLNTSTRLVYPATVGLGVGYNDECTTFGLYYSSSVTDAYNGVRARSQTVLMRLELRTLGDIRVKTGISQSSTGGDSLSNASPWGK